MSVSIANVTLHCRNAEALATFWAEALGWDIVRAEGSATICDLAGGHTTWYFETVAAPEELPGRWHVDLDADDHDSELGRLVGAGASIIDDRAGWTVLADPEGNLFCLLR